MKNQILSLILISLLLFTRAQNFLPVDLTTTEDPAAATDQPAVPDQAASDGTVPGLLDAINSGLGSDQPPADGTTDPAATGNDQNADAAATQDAPADATADQGTANSDFFGGLDIAPADNGDTTTDQAGSELPADAGDAGIPADQAPTDTGSEPAADAAAPADDSGVAGFNFGDLTFGDNTAADQPADQTTDQPADQPLAGDDTIPADGSNTEDAVDVETETAVAPFDFGGFTFGDDAATADQPVEGNDTAQPQDGNDSEEGLDVETETGAAPFDFGALTFGEDTINTDQPADGADTTEPVDTETNIDNENVAIAFGDLTGGTTDENLETEVDTNTEDAAVTEPPTDQSAGDETGEDVAAVDSTEPAEASTEPVVTDFFTIDFASLATGADETPATEDATVGTGDEIATDAGDIPADAGTENEIATDDNTEDAAADVPPGDENVDVNSVDTGLVDIDFGDLIGGTDNTGTDAVDTTSPETPATDNTGADATNAGDEANTEATETDIAATPTSNDATDAGLINIDFGNLIAPTEEPTESVEAPLIDSLNDVIFSDIQPTITEADAQIPAVDPIPLETEDAEPFVIDFNAPIFGSEVIPDPNAPVTEGQDATVTDSAATDLTSFVPDPAITDTASSEPLIDLNAPDVVGAADAATGINDTGVTVQNNVQTIADDFGSFYFDLGSLNLDDTGDTSQDQTGSNDTSTDTQEGQDASGVVASEVTNPTDASGNPYTIQCDFSTGEFACRTCYYVAGCTGDDCAIDRCQ